MVRIRVTQMNHPQPSSKHLQELAFKEVPSPDLSKVAPASTETSPAFFPEHAKTQDHAEEEYAEYSQQTQIQPFEYSEQTQLQPFTTSHLDQNTDHLGVFEQKVGEVEGDGDSGAAEEVTVGEQEEGVTRDVHSKVSEAVSESGGGGSMKEDFDASFNPGFGSFGNFGGQSYASILWGNKNN